MPHDYNEVGKVMREWCYNYLAEIRDEVIDNDSN